MAASAPATFPRFLLPQLSWTPRSSRISSSIGSFSSLSRSHTFHSRASPAQDFQGLSRGFEESRLPYSHIQSRLRTSFAGQQLAPVYSAHRAFSASAAQSKDHHFDTLKFVQRFRDEGFSEEQAVAMMKVLGDVVEESIQNLTRTMVLREDQEKATYTQKVDFAKLRSELLSADSTESSLTRASHERLTNDLAKLNSRLRDEIQRTQASVRLDLNLEKGRIREEANSQELKIKEVETRIEQETAALRERLEQVKFSTLQWLM